MSVAGMLAMAMTDEAPIETESLLARCMADKDFLREMLVLFQDQFTQNLAVLERAIGAGDTDATREAAHAMKGSAANLSAARLSDLCAAIDLTAKSGRLPPASAVEAVKAEFQRVLAYYPTVQSRL
jgi:HPt (histidine-containing phosphotransfer) domain-containing protein